MSSLETDELPKKFVGIMSEGQLDALVQYVRAAIAHEVRASHESYLKLIDAETRMRKRLKKNKNESPDS